MMGSIAQEITLSLSDITRHRSSVKSSLDAWLSTVDHALNAASMAGNEWSEPCGGGAHDTTIDGWAMTR